jgi:hypothetical protein
MAYRAIRPAAAGWLLPRLEGVRVTLARVVAQADVNDERLQLRLDDGSQRLLDRLVLATGYRIDVGRHPLLARRLRQSLRTRGGYPLLTSGGESSIPGLHFVGASAAVSFGPAMRFVSGTWFTARAVAEHVACNDRPASVAVPSAPLIAATGRGDA